MANILVFDGVTHFPAKIPDGTHATIAFTEHYFFAPTNSVYLLWNEIFNAPPLPGVVYGSRRATFADSGSRDVVPVRDPATGQTVASVRGLTFQVRPKFEEINPFIPQTPFASGLPVAMFDGSVRTISPRVAEHVFWSAVTPAGGEVVGLD